MTGVGRTRAGQATSLSAVELCEERLDLLGDHPDRSSALKRPRSRTGKTGGSQLERRRSDLRDVIPRRRTTDLCLVGKVLEPSLDGVGRILAHGEQRRVELGCEGGGRRRVAEG